MTERQGREEIGLNKVTKGTLVIRAMVAAYLLYLAYGLTQDYAAASNRAATVVGIVVFTVCGGVILFMSLKSLAKGDYDGGTEDADTEEPSAEEAVSGAEEGEPHKQ
ncbi:MAG: hypothetical protein J6A08_08390 [Lachnospiraceae bacterium]|nr:hypothetical protein [Lachnospiraceae bacterium]